jgi:myo-inositol catabolism protein IolC
MNGSEIDSNPLFIVALDDRVDLCAEVLNTSDGPSAAEREQAADLKRVVFEGITTAVESGLAKSSVGIWVDSDLGESVLLRARAMSMATVSSPGSGAHSLGRLNVDYTGVQLTFNPDSPKETRSELLARLKIVSDKAREKSMPLLIELDAVPSTTQQEMYGGALEARSVMLLTAVQQLQDSGVEPAVWVFEPVADETYTAALAAQVHIDDRSNTRMLLAVSGDLAQGRVGTDLSTGEKQVVRLAARTRGVDGLLIGPGAYFRHLVRFNEGLIGRLEAIDAIASHLNDLNETFEQSRSASKAL